MKRYDVTTILSLAALALVLAEAAMATSYLSETILAAHRRSDWETWMLGCTGYAQALLGFTLPLCVSIWWFGTARVPLWLRCVGVPVLIFAAAAAFIVMLNVVFREYGWVGRTPRRIEWFIAAGAMLVLMLSGVRRVLRLRFRERWMIAGFNWALLGLLIGLLLPAAIRDDPFMHPRGAAMSFGLKALPLVLGLWQFTLLRRRAPCPSRSVGMAGGSFRASRRMPADVRHGQAPRTPLDHGTRRERGGQARANP